MRWSFSTDSSAPGGGPNATAAAGNETAATATIVANRTGRGSGMTREIAKTCRDLTDEAMSQTEVIALLQPDPDTALSRQPGARLHTAVALAKST